MTDARLFVALVDLVTAALVNARWGPYDPAQGDLADWELAKEGDRNGTADDVFFVLDYLRSLPVEQRMEAMGMSLYGYCQFDDDPLWKSSDA